jgi:hypothetical protein
MVAGKVLVLVFISLASFAAARHCQKIDIDKSSGFWVVSSKSVLLRPSLFASPYNTAKSRGDNHCK